MNTQDSLAAPAAEQQPQQPRHQPEKTSGLAIAGLVLGISGFFFWFFTALPGIICSAIAMRKIARSEGTLGGQGIAIAGLVTGIVSLFLGICTFGILAAMLAGPLMNARTSALKIASVNNMSCIGKACFQYESPSYFDEAPANIEALFRANLLDNEKIITNPITGEKSYIFLPYDRKDIGARITLIETPGTTTDDIAALFKDGHVQRIKMNAEDQKRFVQALQERNQEELKQWQKKLADQTGFSIPGER